MNPFVVDASEYNAQPEFLDIAYDQIEEYLVRMAGCTPEEAKEFVERKKKSTNPEDKKFNTVDPAVRLLTRDRKTEDRSASVVKFSEYRSSVREEKLITTPAWTSYYNHEEKRSVSGEYIEVNLGIRKVAKHKMFVAEMAGDEDEEAYRNSEQSSKKYFNNSLSGSRASKGNIFFCKSAHPSLTSPCRATTGVANAHNEKFLAGNRYYPGRDHVVAQLLVYMTKCPTEEVKATCEKYGIVYPTVDQVLELIHRSFTRYAFSGVEQFRNIVEKMTDQERAYFSYAGDMYHLYMFNPEFVRNLVNGMSDRSPTEVDAPPELFDDSHEDVQLHAAFLCGDLIKGQRVSDVKKNDPKTFSVLAKTADMVNNNLAQYEGIIKTFWLSPIPPNNISHTAFISRRVLPLSDTDSTVFTNQFWTQSIQKKDAVDFSHKSSCISSAMTYITAQVVRHWIAIFTTNSGIPPEYRGKISMKNEFASPLLALTSASKHYAMYSTVCEGNILPKPRLDIKGVNMRSSNWPAEVKELHEKWVLRTFEKIMEEGNISIHEFLKTPWELERRMLRSLTKGEYTYLGKMRINPRDSYKNPESSNYVHYDMWQETFGSVYGMVGEPPYRGIQVPVKLTKPKQIKAWIDKIENPALKTLMEKYFLETKKGRVWTQLIIPEVIGQQSGIPKEIIDVIDMRRILNATMKGFYMVLGAYGLDLADEKQAKLLSDVYIPPEISLGEDD